MNDKRMFFISFFAVICSFVIALCCCFLNFFSSKAYVQLENSNIYANSDIVLVSNSTDSLDNIVMEVNYTGSVNDIVSGKFSFTYYTAVSELSSSAYRYIIGDCSFTPNFGINTYSYFTCTKASYIDMVLMSYNDLSSMFTNSPIIVDLRKVEIPSDSLDWSLNFNKLPLITGSYSSPSVSFVPVSNSYNSGVADGVQIGTLRAYNSIYREACLINNNSTTGGVGRYCLDNKYDTLPTTYKFLDDLLLLFDSNSGVTTAQLFDNLRAEYLNSYNSCMSTLNYSSCLTWSSTNTSLSNLSTGIDVIVNNRLIVEYSAEYDPIYNAGYVDGRSDGYELGYDVGYESGFLEGQEAEDVVGNAVISVASVPLSVLSGMLSFDILGFNVLGLVLGLFTLLLIIWVLKKVFK